MEERTYREFREECGSVQLEGAVLLINVCNDHLNYIKVIYGIFEAFLIKKVKAESEFCCCCSLKWVSHYFRRPWSVKHLPNIFTALLLVSDFRERRDECKPRSDTDNAKGTLDIPVLNQTKECAKKNTH